MGCGCRKNTNTRKIRSAAIARAKQKERLAARAKSRADRAVSRVKGQAVATRKAKYGLITQRMNICKSCSHSQQTPLDKKRLVRICHKLNKLIKEISSETNSKCPVGKF